MKKSLYGVFEKIDGATRHVMSVPVHYEDTDFSGFVYHANYLKFAERGRSNFLNMCGITHTDLLALEPPLAFVVGHMDVDFLMPAGIDDELLVKPPLLNCAARAWWPSSAFQKTARRFGRRMCWRLVSICKAARNACQPAQLKS